MVGLVPADRELLDAALRGDAELAAALGHPVVPVWATFVKALETAPMGRWGTRMFLAGDPAELVGWGGFKGPPRDGEVELGYVDVVVAHTLAERNASNRVLEKAGFAFEREAQDGEHPVWRFRRDR